MMVMLMMMMMMIWYEWPYHWSDSSDRILQIQGYGRREVKPREVLPALQAWNAGCQDVLLLYKFVTISNIWEWSPMYQGMVILFLIYTYIDI